MEPMEPYKNLWIAVIHQAVKDIRDAEKLEYKVTHGLRKEPKNFAERLRYGRLARRWINKEGNSGIADIEYLCDFCGLDVNVIREGI